MNFFIILLTVTTSVWSLLPALQGRSSFLHIVEDYYLAGHVVDRQKAPSVLSCAHLCLKSRPLCRSLNYGQKEGKRICELNDEGTDMNEAGFTSLVPMSGFIFGQLFNLTVSKAQLVKPPPELGTLGPDQMYLHVLKGATSRFEHLEKFGLNLSSMSFAIRFNLLHP